MKIVIRQAVPSLFCMLILMLQEMINLVSLNGALETLVSQSYGSGNLKLCGTYLNRGRFILLCSFVPVAIILSNAQIILVTIGQNAQVANYAQHYIKAYMPGLFLNGLFDGQRRFLNSLGRSDDPLLFQVVGIVLHVLWCYLFVTKMELGIEGIGYASTLSNLTVYSSLVIYSSCIPELSEAVFFPDKKTFTMISQYL